MSDAAFFSEFGEVHRVTRHIKGMTVDEAASNMLNLYKRHATEVHDVITKGIKVYAKDINDGSVPNSCLLILPGTAGRNTGRLRRSKKRWSFPCSSSTKSRDGETNRGLLARVTGSGRFDGLNKKIGSRELFFAYLLFRSTRSLDFAGERLVVVTQDEAVNELLKWRDDGYLQFAGKDRGQSGA